MGQLNITFLQIFIFFLFYGQLSVSSVGISVQPTIDVSSLLVGKYKYIHTYNNIV